MQYRSPNASIDSCSCQTVSIVIRLDTMGGRISARCDFVWPFNMCVVVGHPITLIITLSFNESVHRKEQLATIINTKW